MANHKEIVPFFYKWEGGLSKDKNDSASSNPCPTPFNGVKGYHTNKGVTYKAWTSVFGTSQDARFFEMNNNDWGAIFKRGYWDKVKGDKIQFQSIANVLVSWAWGSGSRTAVKQMQRVLNVSDDGVIGNQTLNALHACNEVELFDKCVIARGQFFESIARRNPKNLKFLKGWMNRLKDFNSKFRPV